MKTKTLKLFGISIAVLFVTLVLALVVHNTVSVGIVMNHTANYTITPIGNGVDSLSVYVHDTWLDLNGSMQYITLNYEQNMSKNHSYSVWYNTTQSKDITYIFGNQTNESLYILNGYPEYAYPNETGDLNNLSAPLYYTNNTAWHNVVVTAGDDLNITIYLDGVIANSTAVVGAMGVVNTTWNIGNLTEAFNGSIDELRIYNQTLSAVEIEKINISGRTPNHTLNDYGDTLMLWLSFNEKAGTRLYDISNQSTNGTITGGTWNNAITSTALTRGTHYLFSRAGQFELIDVSYDRSWINLTYDYNTGTPSTASADSKSTCTGVWRCSIWSLCRNGRQTRVCTPRTTCTRNKPATSRACGNAITDIITRPFRFFGEKVGTIQKCARCPSPTGWTACINNQKSRTNSICSAETNYECKTVTETVRCRARGATLSIFSRAGLH